ncbi:uncharacterized protein LOC114522848 isoform X2 [Dendronephthya gigantea]|uniref:uncharacterized protein LOC114522848 isoform X2 n=1 Tax=Dendronephthya gigantea TaxID=151771 RepID=UPI00106D3FD8|nr:uncharacterized protein LOC114522848 isoform X2 [Dendronephthya gigantea]
MKLPKGLPNDVVLRTWMAQGKGNEPELNTGSFVSPILKESANGVHPHVVTLSLRPFRTTNLSVDSFMASHSPRRSSSNKQKFMLKPLSLDQRNCSSNVHTTFGKDALELGIASSLKDHERIPHGKSDIRADRPQSNYSCQNRVNKPLASVVNCIDYDPNYSSKLYTVPDGTNLYTSRNNSFRPPPRISHLTGQKITFGNTYGFNYHTGYINLLQTQTDLVATGTPVSTIGPKQNQATKPSPRWQTVKSALNEKGCKYVDPMLGCNSGFQARMSEITQHELDTVKWEKGKKGKKKTG